MNFEPENKPCPQIHEIPYIESRCELLWVLYQTTMPQSPFKQAYGVRIKL